MGSEDQDIRTGLQSLVQSWRACLNIVPILAVVSLPAVAVAQDAGDIQRLERQLEDLANQVQELKQQLDTLRKKTASKQEVEQIQRQVEENAEFRGADIVMHLAGYGSVLYKDGDNSDSTFAVGSFNPILHFQYKDLILLESELEFEIQDDGETEVELEYLSLDLFLHDNVTLVGGKFLSPVGYFRQNLHPAWINKLPTAPIGFGHDQAAPVADIGVQLRGGLPIPLGDMTLHYSIFVVNGPRLEVEDGEVEAVETEGFAKDDNGDKVFGGRFAFRPFQKMELGFSGQFGEVRAEGDADRDYDVYDVDFNLTGLNFAPGLDLRAEYVYTRVGSGGTIDPEKKVWEAWYMQGGYLLPWFPVEVVVRYGEYDTSETDQDQWAIGLNYLFANQVIGKVAYEMNDIDGGQDEDFFIVELAYGF